jgi:phosphate transport system permease protein
VTATASARTRPADRPPPPPRPAISRRRRVTNRAATGLIYLAVVVAAVPLLLLVYFVTIKGASQLGWSFLTDPLPKSARRASGGIGPAIIGTVLCTALAAVMAIPLGVLGAVYLNEYGKTSRMATIMRFLANVLAGVPSIVMGLFIYTIFVLRFQGGGRIAFAGALALACLMLPIVIRSTEEMLRLVPTNLREASMALGASQSRTILTVVLPAALPGITSGSMLAVARAAGETAPVLFTIGFATEANWNPFSGPNTTLAQFIFGNAGQPFPAAVDRAWGAAFTLIVMVLLLTVAARYVSARFTVR